MPDTKIELNEASREEAELIGSLRAELEKNLSGPEEKATFVCRRSVTFPDVEIVIGERVQQVSFDDIRRRVEAQKMDVWGKTLVQHARNRHTITGPKPCQSCGAPRDYYRRIDVLREVWLFLEGLLREAVTHEEWMVIRDRISSYLNSEIPAGITRKDRAGMGPSAAVMSLMTRMARKILLEGFHYVQKAPELTPETAAEIPGPRPRRKRGRPRKDETPPSTPSPQGEAVGSGEKSDKECLTPQS